MRAMQEISFHKVYTYLGNVQHIKLNGEPPHFTHIEEDPKFQLPNKYGKYNCIVKGDQPS